MTALAAFLNLCTAIGQSAQARWEDFIAPYRPQPDTDDQALAAAIRTEWAHRLENGGAIIWPTRRQAEADRDDYLTQPRDPFEPKPPASAGIWRREVTDWRQVNQ